LNLYHYLQTIHLNINQKLK